MKQKMMTVIGYEKESKKLEYLKFEKRNAIAERIKVARGFGDLSENAEYDEARNAQAENEMEIERIENIFKNLKVIEPKDVPDDIVYLGTTVKLFDYTFDEEIEYDIVGLDEADPFNDKISYESPMGKELFEKKIGDIVEIKTPGGMSKYKVLEIRRWLCN